MTAASLRTVAGSVIVTGRPAPGAGGAVVQLGDRDRPAADGTTLPAGRGGCQATQASTRIPVCPPPALATSTTISLVIRAPSGADRKSRSQAGGPKSASPG